MLVYCRKLSAQCKNIRSCPWDPVSRVQNPHKNILQKPFDANKRGFKIKNVSIYSHPFFNKMVCLIILSRMARIHVENGKLHFIIFTVCMVNAMTVVSSAFFIVCEFYCICVCVCVCCNVLNVRVHVKFAMERPYLKRRPSSPSPPSTYPHPVPSLLLSTSFPPPHPPSTPPPSLTPRRFRSTTSHGNAAMGPQTHFAKCGGGMWRLELDKKEKAAMKNMYMCKAEGIRLL